MAPEIHIGELYSREADLWSLGLYVKYFVDTLHAWQCSFILILLSPQGCILFELCSLRPAFTGSNSSLLNQIVQGAIPSLKTNSSKPHGYDIHPTISPLVSHLLVRDAQKRMKASDLLER